jgi:hypothetical protein
MSKPFGATSLLTGWFSKIILCLGVGGVLWACVHHTHRPPKPASHLSPTQVYQRAETIAALYGNTFELTDAPILLKHSTWTISCQSDDLSLYMTFDDATGRLWDLGIKASLEPHTPMMAPLDTAAEARQVALHRLHDLQMVPQGSRLALARPPVCSPISGAWEMRWTVTPPDGSRSYPIFLVLNRRTGIPMRVMNLEKARQYAATSTDLL